MIYSVDISVKHTVSADPIFCAMLDGKERRHCKYEHKGACGLFCKALKDSNGWNMKCAECIKAYEQAKGRGL